MAHYRSLYNIKLCKSGVNLSRYLNLFSVKAMHNWTPACQSFIFRNITDKCSIFSPVRHAIDSRWVIGISTITSNYCTCCKPNISYVFCGVDTLSYKPVSKYKFANYKNLFPESKVCGQLQDTLRKSKSAKFRTSLHRKIRNNVILNGDSNSQSASKEKCHVDNQNLLNLSSGLLKPFEISSEDIQIKEKNVISSNYANNKLDSYSLIHQNIVGFNLVSSSICYNGNSEGLMESTSYPDSLNSSLYSRKNQQFLQKDSGVYYCSSSNDVSTDHQGSPKGNGEELDKIFKVLSEELPNFFTHAMNYSNYSPDVVFENRIRGTHTVGLHHYIRQVAFLRIVGHFRFSYVKFEILKITQHSEDKTVRVRWRIIGVAPMKSFFLIWKAKGLKNLKENYDKWFDGFSTFHVNENGLISKHIADKMMPDEEREVFKSSLTSRLASITGLAPKEPAVTNTSSHVVDVTKNKREYATSSDQFVVDSSIIPCP